MTGRVNDGFGGLAVACVPTVVTASCECNYRKPLQFLDDNSDERRSRRELEKPLRLVRWWMNGAPTTLEEWIVHRLYTPLVADSEWRDQNGPFWYVWQFHTSELESEFVNLSYAGESANVYCLVRADAAEVGRSDYFMLSREGLTHVVKGASSFIPIAQWLRGLINFRRCLRVPFFGGSRALRSQMVTELDELDVFRLSVDEVRGLAVEVAAVRLFDVLAVGPLTVWELADKQAAHAAEARVVLGTVHRRARDIIMSACENAYRAAREGRWTLAVCSGAALRVCRRRIRRFIRLCDVLLFEALLECVRESADAMVGWLLSAPPARPIVVEFEFDHFEPACEFFAEVVEKSWLDAVESTSVFERFLCSRDFVFYARDSRSELQATHVVGQPGRLGDVLGRDGAYRATLSRLKAVVLGLFSELELLTKAKLQPYEKVLARARRPALEYRDGSACVFGEVFGELRLWLGAVEWMPRVVEHRLVEVRLEKMREMVSSAARSGLAQLGEHVSTLALGKATRLNERLNEVIGKLQVEAKDVLHFGSQLELYRMGKSDKPWFGRDLQEVNELHDLLNSEGFRNRSLTKVVTETGRKYASFGVVLSRTAEQHKVSRGRWVDVLEEQLAMLGEEASSALLRVQNLTDNVEASLEKLEELETKGRVLALDLGRYHHIQELMSVKATEVDEVGNFLEELKKHRTLYATASEWRAFYAQTLASELKQIDRVQFSEAVERFTENVRIVGQIFPTKRLAMELQQDLSEFRALARVLVTLRSPSLRTRHWRQIETLLKLEGELAGGTRVGQLVASGAVAYSSEIGAIALEAETEVMLKNVKVSDGTVYEAENLNFQVVPLMEGQLVVSGLSEIRKVLDESLVKCGTARQSRSIVAAVQRDVTMVELRRMEKIVELVESVQSRWLFLGAFFRERDLQQRLASDLKAFNEVDQEYRRWVRTVREQPRVYPMAGSEDAIETLQRWELKLETVGKGVDEFLGSRRAEFPRFFFLSSEDLIDVLSLPGNAVGVEKHLNKLFGNVNCLGLSADGKWVEKLISKEGEAVGVRRVEVRGPAENWLKAVEFEMKRSLQQIAAEAVVHYPFTPTREWARAFPAQLIVAVSNVFFTESVTDNVEDLDLVLDGYAKRLEGLAVIVRDRLDAVQREAITALIEVNVRQRDIVGKLLAGGGDRVESEWAQQQRFYFEGGKLVVRQYDAAVEYGYEYLGVAPRSLVTEPTEKSSYMALTGVRSLHRGCAGPGTLTELAKALGMLCVVFHCSERVTTNELQLFLSGLCQTGAFGCIDEFNCVDPGVLSVFADNLGAIQNALCVGRNELLFCGKEMPLSARCGAFIAMGPGKAGSAELPGNLKELLRPVAVVVPDITVLCEIALYQNGFREGSDLAETVAQLCSPRSESLSPPSRCHFGATEVLSVLSRAGEMKRLQPRVSERQLLFRAMEDGGLLKARGDDGSLPSEVFKLPLQLETDLNEFCAMELRRMATFRVWPSEPFRGRGASRRNRPQSVAE